MIESGYISKADLIRAKMALHSVSGTASQLTKEISVNQKSLKEAENRLIQLTQTEKHDSDNRLEKF
ncbi:hypothetical protein [Coxiella-like endosymbiont]|uniref:hypothetical protein n=1 Tax=Coxiella-like endosymbiont TaxID=1592897 RepID=UPI00272D7118|nr:hypothetical protein [Coxiella-like endosymbiont]